MAGIQCPSCGHRGEVPDTLRGQKVRCPKCREKLRVAREVPWLPIVIATGLLVIVVCLGILILRQNSAVEPTVPVAETSTKAPTAKVEVEEKKKEEPVIPEPILHVKKASDPKRDEEARLEEARRKEEARLAEENARIEKELKEQKAREEREKRLAQKRDPKLTAHLEEIEKDPVKFLGKCLTVDRVSVKMTAIAKHGELGRYTIGVTSQRGTYFSRTPLGGLVVSTTEKAAKQLIEKAGPLDVLPRIKIFCEIRQWDKNGKAYPEAFAYRIEVYDSAGRVDAVVEVPPDP